jgi:hypothetical protein
MNYALISNGLVVGIIVWDGVSGYTPPEGYQLVALQADEAEVGSAYENGVFTPPVQPPEPEPALDQPTSTGTQEL